MRATTQIEEPSSLTDQLLFYRREDLTASVRLKIATIALFFQLHGTITQLSKRYDISRQFVYDLRNALRDRLSGLFEPKSEDGTAEQDKRSLLRWILYLRLVGQCSLQAISCLLQALDLGRASPAYISEQLSQIGTKLGQRLSYEGEAVFLCDEVFCPDPILVSVEPQSMAILGIEKVDRLSKDCWIAHWQDLERQGIHCAGFITDQGSALRQAQKDHYADRPFQSDTFHAVAYQLGRFKTQLKNKAYRAIAKEYDRQAVWQRAIENNFPIVVQQKKESYLKARQACQEVVDQYDIFVFLYHHILEQLQVVDQQGQVRCRQQAEQEIRTALECMGQLPIKGLDYAIRGIKTRLEAKDLLPFLEKAQRVFERLGNEIPSCYLPFWAMAWQAHRNYIKAKTPKRRQAAQSQYQWPIALLEQDLSLSQEEFKRLKQYIFSRLDCIVQSSALVESLNSILRSYAHTTRQQMSQSFLQLIMFFHNHRKFERGKRKGKAPIELLTGTQLDKGPIDLILDLVA
jgi:hypothetical protein